MKNTQIKILNHTKYLGSGSSKVVHKTINACEDAYRIPVDERWYINKIPSNFIKCPKCFGLEKVEEITNIEKKEIFTEEKEKE